MSANFLRQFFSNVAVKRLSAVEVDPERSNQHEFNGVSVLKEILGEERREKIPTTFIWLGKEQEGFTEEGTVTWYDAREDKPTRSAEYRLYFTPNRVMDMASEQDSVFIATRPDKSFMVIIAPAFSTMEQQIVWLFGLEGQLQKRFAFGEIDGNREPSNAFATRHILETLGLEPEEPETDDLDRLLEGFGGKFPTTREFSLLARNSLSDISPRDDPDAALIAWMEREESLFKRLERHLLEERLQQGFGAEREIDVEGFLHFSLSVQNRRKSRVGLAFENHLEAIFASFDIRYSRGKVTENKTKPDFIFPSIEDYHSPSFPAHRLTMLGVKSTCKDRWRQVLSEAEKIDAKHLITLEPGISQNQTDEMQKTGVQLVLPHALHDTFKPAQRGWLFTVSKFLALTQERQAASNP